MNYIYQNQNQLEIKVNIVDFPYMKTKSLYNVRSKGAACGGLQIVKGKLLNGRQGQIIGDVYPTSTYYIKDNKLFTQDHKQIKGFHYAEGLGARTPADEQTYDEAVNEMKTIWFNPETINFYKEQCGCVQIVVNNYLNIHPCFLVDHWPVYLPILLSRLNLLLPVVF